MKKTKDPFNIKIVLRHPSYKPTDISKALSLKPEFSYAVGQKFLKSSAKWTSYLLLRPYWHSYPLGVSI